MMGIPWIPYAIWAAIALAALVGKTGQYRSVATAIVGAVFVIFVLFNLFDSVERDRNVAVEPQRVATEIISEFLGAFLLGQHEVLSAFERPVLELDSGDAGLSYVDNAVAPIAAKPLDEMIKARMDLALLEGRPVYLVMRTSRYDTRVMRALLPNEIGTNQLSEYSIVLADYELSAVIEVGRHHELFRVTDVKL